ncbi:MAG: PqqD family protein [Candidatus Methylomirabilia bacterium]
MPRQTRLELLVRRDDEGFEIREVPSSLAYLHYKPQRVPVSDYELARLSSLGAGLESYVLKNRATERYLLLTEPEHFLWELMDGRTTIQALAAAYVLRYGAFDFDLIPALIAKLRHADLLTFRPASSLREAVARHRRNPVARAVEATLRRLGHLTLSSRRVQTTFERLHRWGGRFLFAIPALPFGALLVGLGAVSAATLWDQAPAVAAPLAQRPILSLVSVKLFLLGTMAFHQMVHGLACVHYGRRVREYGFTMLHGFIPTFFVDVTDIFMASRRARVLTALSGALTHVFLASVHFWAAVQMPSGLGQSFIAMGGVLQLQALFISLYPFAFLEMDGYHILVDALGLPTLRHDAWQFVRHELWRRLAAFRGLTRRETIWVGYFVLCLTSIVAFVGLNLWGFVHASG